MVDKARILIVDDNEINRDTLEGLVEALGHVVIMAENGREALNLIRLPPQPDLVLLDLLMPEMGGDEVLRFIKEDKSLNSIPVIMISVVDELEAVVQCIEAGAEDYLSKPFNAILLKARINACLEKKRAHDKEQKFNFWLAESYRKLQQAENDREAYFNMIVHDINNPLASIMLQLEGLILDFDECDHRCQSLHNINAAVLQVAALVKSILDVSRMENGLLETCKGGLDGVQVAKDIVAQFTPLSVGESFSLKTRVQAEEITLQTDRGLLTRILQNLLANAIKHGRSDSDTEIEVVVERADGRICFSVSDNGPGIPEAELDKIFTKFYQVDNAQKGLGLGLTFCKLAAAALDGEISVSNRAQGGASFCLSLPDV